MLWYYPQYQRFIWMSISYIIYCFSFITKYTIDYKNLQDPYDIFYHLELNNIKFDEKNKKKKISKTLN
jgi:hypothetical protein